MLYLIDAPIFIFRAWHTVPNDVVDYDGNPVNALHGFARFLGDLIEREKPGHIAVGVDEWTALLVQGERIGVIGREGRGAYYHFADAVTGQVRRYRLGAGEAVNVGAPVLGADHEAVEAALRQRQLPEVLTAEWIAEPDE